MTTQQLLTLAIEAKRSELYHQADQSSFTSPRVLQLSHELDVLLLEYSRMSKTIPFTVRMNRFYLNARSGQHSSANADFFVTSYF